MKLKLILLLAAAFQVITANAASASHLGRHHLHSPHIAHQLDSPHKSADGRPSAWCGWEMRQLVGGNPGPEYNLARNWAHWGRPASGPAPGVIGVMAHHVFKVVQVMGNGTVLAISGNDGHAVRTRPRSTAGVIAWRMG
jgi:hypothetical protein